MKTVHAVADSLCRELDVVVIELWDRLVQECALCGEVKVCRHCVAFYCEPTYDEIGSVSTVYRSTDDKPAIVGGMVCCKDCHDKHEAGRPGRAGMIEALETVRSPDVAATPQQPAFLKSLQHTLNVMKKAHASGGDRRMSIWTEDVQAVEEAIAALGVAQAPAKSLSDYTDAEIAREHGWRMQRALGDPRVCVGASVPSTQRACQVCGETADLKCGPSRFGAETWACKDCWEPEGSTVTTGQERTMTDFETASAKYHEAIAAYVRAESALAAARHDLTVAERERSAAFRKEVEAARSRNAVGDAPGPASKLPPSHSPVTKADQP